jgi:hypothetical protein
MHNAKGNDYLVSSYYSYQEFVSARSVLPYASVIGLMYREYQAARDFSKLRFTHLPAIDPRMHTLLILINYIIVASDRPQKGVTFFLRRGSFR